MNNVLIHVNRDALANLDKLDLRVRKESRLSFQTF